MSDKQNAFMRAPIDYLCNQKKPTIAQVAYVFATLRQHGRDGGTYRYLIYDLLGFDESAYTPLYFAGGMELSNLFCTRDEFDALQARIAQALEVIDKTLGTTEHWENWEKIATEYGYALREIHDIL